MGEFFYDSCLYLNNRYVNGMSNKKCILISDGVVKFRNCVRNISKLVLFICIILIRVEVVFVCFENIFNVWLVDELSVSVKLNVVINIGNINVRVVCCWFSVNIKILDIISNKRLVFNVCFGWCLMYSGIIKLVIMFNIVL